MKVAGSPVRKLALGVDDCQLLAGIESGKIISMDVVSGEVMWMVSESSLPVSALAIGAMDKRYDGSDTDCTANFCNTPTKVLPFDCRTIVVSGSDEDPSFQVWDLSTGQALSKTELPSSTCDLAVQAPGTLVTAYKSRYAPLLTVHMRLYRSSGNSCIENFSFFFVKIICLILFNYKN